MDSYIMSRVINKIAKVTTHIKGHLTPLITTREPPSICIFISRGVYVCVMCVYIHTYDIYIYMRDIYIYIYTCIYIYIQREREAGERDRNTDGSCSLCELFEFPVARTPVTLNV